MSRQSQHFSALRKWLLSIFLMAFATSFVACSQIDPNQLATLSTALETARLQSVVVFKGVNDLSIEESIDYAAAQSKLDDKDSAFVIVVTSDAAKRWNKAFQGLETYVQAQQALLQTGSSRNFGSAVVGLATELKSIDKKAVLDPGLAAAFAEIGDMLIEAAAQDKVKSALHDADKPVRRILELMASAIGDNDEVGLRAVCASNFKTLAGQNRAAFANAATGARRPFAVIESNLIQRNAAQDAALASFRQSLLSLADAHTATANGSPMTAAAALAKINAELTQSKTYFDEFKALKSK